MESRAVLALARRDVASFFLSPMGYVVVGFFLLLAGWSYFSLLFVREEADLREFFEMLPVLFAFVLPAVTMRLLAEERQSGSLELLLTLPVGTATIVAGKFLAALAIVCVLLLPTVSYPLSVSVVGDLDPGPVASGYAAALLLGAAFAAVGILMSALTHNQIIAFVLAFAACLVLAVLDQMLVFAPGRAVATLEFLAANFHFERMVRGVVDSRDLIYFLSVIALALLGTHRALEARR